MIKTSLRDFIDVILHRQFAVQGNSKIANDVSTLNDITHVKDDVLVEAARFFKLVRDPNQMNSDFFGFICSRLDEHHRWISATHCCSRSTVDLALAVVVDAII